MALTYITYTKNNKVITKVIGDMPTENNFTDALKLKLESVGAVELTTEQLNYIASLIPQGLSIEQIKANIEIASALSLKHSIQDLSDLQPKETGKGLSTNDYLIGTISQSQSERKFQNNALDIPVNAGDYFEIKAVNPTWVTNPLTTIFGGYVYIE